MSPLGRHSCKAQGGESAVGTNRTLGTHGQKNKSSVGAALSARAFVLRLGSAAPVGGSKNVCQCLTQGLRPGLCRSAALAGLILPFVLCVSRVSYWASPSFHPGLCRSVALAGSSSTNLKSRLVRRTCFRRTQTNKKHRPKA